MSPTFKPIGVLFVSGRARALRSFNVKPDGSRRSATSFNANAKKPPTEVGGLVAVVFRLAAEHSDPAATDDSGGRRAGIGRVGLALIDLALINLTLINLATPLSRVALGVRFGVLSVAGRMAAAVDLAARRAGVSAADHASVAALGDHSAVADVGTAASEIQLNVVGRPGLAAADTDRITQGDPVGAGSEGESVTEIDSVFRTAAGFGDLDHAACVGTGSGTSAGDVDPRSGRLGGNFSGRSRQGEGEQGGGGDGAEDLAFHGFVSVECFLNRVSCLTHDPAAAAVKPLKQNLKKERR